MNDMNFNEACYKVDDAFLLHLKEAEDGCHYAAFDAASRQKIGDGVIAWRDIEGSSARSDFAAFREAAVDAVGLDGGRIAEVSVNMLENFRDSEIRRRKIWEPETLPQKDIRVIDSSYNEQFRIPDGGCLQITYSDREFSVKCEHIDPYHSYYGSEVFHICQFAEIVEKNGGIIQPEPELMADEAAWKLGWRNYLTVEASEDGWDYTIYDEKFGLVDGGLLDNPSLSMNEARDEILSMHNMEHRSLYREDFDTVKEKAAHREAETIGEKRESVLGQLSALKSTQKEASVPAPARKKDEVSL